MASTGFAAPPVADELLDLSAFPLSCTSDSPESTATSDSPDSTASSDSPKSTATSVAESPSDIVSSTDLSSVSSDNETTKLLAQSVTCSVQPCTQSVPLNPTHSTLPQVGGKLSILRDDLRLSRSISPYVPNRYTGRLAPLYSDVILASVDCEAYEDGRNKVTEVGVTFLDTRRIRNVEPGPDGKKWFEQMEYRHFIIDEHRHLVNTKQLHGCPEKFNFGRSEVIKQADAKWILQELFTRPETIKQEYIYPFEDGPFEGEDLVEEFRPAGALIRDHPPSHSRCRRIVLVGHSLADDVKYLKLVGFDVESHIRFLERMNAEWDSPYYFPGEQLAPRPKVIGPFLSPSIDTHTLIQDELKIVLSVGKMAYLLGLEPKNLHNAGNDAAYTLQSMISLAFRCHEVFEIPYWPRELLTFKQARKRDEKERAEKVWPLRTVRNQFDNAVYVYKIVSTPRRMKRVLKACQKSLAGFFGRWTGAIPAADHLGSASMNGKGKAPSRDPSPSSESGSSAGDSASKDIDVVQASKPKTQAQIDRKKRARQNRKANKHLRKDEEGNELLGGAFVAGVTKASVPEPNFMQTLGLVSQ